MADLPLVSIVAISYNTSKYIIATLDSIKNQTYANIELVIADDCSTDNSMEIVEHWLKEYKKPYKLIKHEINKGTCATYNSGLRASSGKYYMVIDTDDLILPEKIEKQVSMMESTDSSVGAVYSDAYVIDDSGNTLDNLFIQIHRKFDKIPSGNIYDLLLQGNYLPCMTFLVKMDVFKNIGEYDETLDYEDYDLWLRIAQKYQILFSEYVSCKYRIRSGSLSSTLRNWDYSDARIFLKHIGAPLPMERITAICYRFYNNSDEQGMPFVREYAYKTKDRRIMAAWLLWYFKIQRDIAEQIIENVDKNINDGVPVIIDKTGSDIDIFMNEIVQPDMCKKLASHAYYHNRSETLPFIKQLANRTNSRYYKAVLLLWKYKVNATTGEIILERIDSYCQAKRSNVYIDLCIYKDIYGAFATKNSTFFQTK